MDPELLDTALPTRFIRVFRILKPFLPSKLPGCGGGLRSLGSRPCPPGGRGTRLGLPSLLRTHGRREEHAEPGSPDSGPARPGLRPRPAWAQARPAPAQAPPLASLGEGSRGGIVLGEFGVTTVSPPSHFGRDPKSNFASFLHPPSASPPLTKKFGTLSR